MSLEDVADEPESDGDDELADPDPDSDEDEDDEADDGVDTVEPEPPLRLSVR